jgi:hypothetical protein
VESVVEEERLNEIAFWSSMTVLGDLVPQFRQPVNAIFFFELFSHEAKLPWVSQNE